MSVTFGSKKPNEYCTTNFNCVEGLVCNEFSKCSCPRPCVYDEDKEVCDCGLVSVESPSVVIAIGIFLSFVSVLLWVFIIYKTMQRSILRRRVLSSESHSPRGDARHSQQGYNTQETPYSLHPMLPDNANPLIEGDFPKKDDPPPYNEAIKSNLHFDTNKGSSPYYNNSLIDLPPINPSVDYNLPNTVDPFAPPISPPSYSEVNNDLPYSLNPPRY